MRPVGEDPADPAYRPDIQDAVAGLLGRWGDSLQRPPATAADSLPDSTWEQILTGVQAGIPGEADDASGRRRMLPGGRWTTPLVAVSAVALALVLGTTVLERVGGDAPADAPVVASNGTNGSNAAGTDDTGTDDTGTGATQADEPAGPQILQAGFVPPAKKVMSLPQDISAESIPDTVDELLAASGVEEATDVLTMPVETWQPVPGGMTADAQTLRDCITKVTKVDTSQALLVVRAKVNGLDAGLIVVPEFMVDMNKMKDMDAQAMRRMGKQMQMTTVYLVEPTCGMREPEHDPTLLRVAFSLTP
jgi:hypothetical protein